MTNSSAKPFRYGHTESDPLLVESSAHQTTMGPSGSHNPSATFMEDLGTYDDFHTIDWLREMTRNRLRHRQLHNEDNSCIHSIKRLHDASSGWFVVFLVGLAAGAYAGMIDITTKWLSDIKLGICSNRFWLNKAACCWGTLRNETIQIHGVFSPPANGCSWTTWNEMFGLNNYNDTTIYAVNYLMFMATAVGFATLGGILVKVLAPYASGSGIPEVKTILSGFIIRGYLGKWTLLIKSVTAPLAVASNLSLGKEGPLVHISACCGNLFSYWFPKYSRNEAKKREVFAAAAAAGVAVAFGAPIGGVLFSLEEVSYYFPMKTLWRSFFCALTAAFVLRSINPFNDPHTVMFYVNYSKPWFLFELIPFALIGVIGGMIGAAFIHANLKWCKIRSTTKLGKYPIVEIIVLTIITTAVGYLNPYTRMGASAMIRELVQDCGPFSNKDLCQDHFTRTSSLNDKDQPALSGLTLACVKLLTALIFKFTITVFTFGIKLPAGLFIPSMAIGALMGRLVGIGMEQLVINFPSWPLWKYSCGSGHTCVTPGLYAMVGAAATLGGVTRMTVSLVVIMFELTGGFVYIVPLMTAAMFSKWVGDAFGKEGIYDGHIRLNGYPFLDNKEEFIHTSLAADVMQPQLGEPPLKVVTQEGLSVNDLEVLVQTTKFNGFPVITSVASQKLVGYLYRRDLTIALENARKHCKNVKSESKVYFTLQVPTFSATSIEPQPVPLFNIVDLSPIIVSDHTPMEIVVEIFSKLGIRQTLVTHNGCLLGIITKKDLLRHIAKLNGEDPASIMFN